MAGDMAELLKTAVRTDDVETALKILEEAGGSCQARDLALRAVTSAKKDDSTANIYYSVNVHGDKEGLTMYRSGPGSLPVAGIEQDRCKR